MLDTAKLSKQPLTLTASSSAIVSLAANVGAVDAIGVGGGPWHDNGLGG